MLSDQAMHRAYPAVDGLVSGVREEEGLAKIVATQARRDSLRMRTLHGNSPSTLLSRESTVARERTTNDVEHLPVLVESSGRNDQRGCLQRRHSRNMAVPKMHHRQYTRTTSV